VKTVGNLNSILADLLQSHGLSVSQDDEWIVANDCLLALSATVVSENQLPSGYSLQLDIRVAPDSSDVMIESFGGIGDNRDEAVADAVANFAANSLHTLLAAFYGQEDDQVIVEMWEIGAVAWRVIIGGYGIRSSEGIKVAVPEQAFQVIEDLIKRLTLEGTGHQFWCGFMDRFISIKPTFKIGRPPSSGSAPHCLVKRCPRCNEVISTTAR
jgi:hypothetical protein